MIDGIIITQHISLNRNCWLWKLHVSACANCRLAMADYANIHTHVHIGQGSLKHPIHMNAHFLKEMHINICTHKCTNVKLSTGHETTEILKKKKKKNSP